jgi:hypothetical protein
MIERINEMKVNARLIWAILLTCILLATAAFPAEASGSPKDISGRIVYQYDPPADTKQWFTGDGAIYHMRGDLQVYTTDFDDDRLDGDMLSDVNCDGHMDLSGNPIWFVGHFHAQNSITNAAGELIWEGVSNSLCDSYGACELTYVLNGQGEYQGLTAIISADFYVWEGADNARFSGQLVEPGN